MNDGLPIKVGHRNLKNGSTSDSYDRPIDIIIHTKSPGKWLIIDLETGEEYLGSEQPHGSFAEILRERVQKGIIGSWRKIKNKDGKNLI